ncbi:hypothetical protein FA13DRAFT_1796589 [Coprinellus micaceus]|uniref:Ubiquitin-like protease family profile domain-containing protein n=1 Tax=Coprinellus micaceus TaxID=71717 RepID=A0A4Y7STI7_COPMI|nr:hypothetical protein FA13DRAFT_1796589 [Coprinellus micaceus]
MSSLPSTSHLYEWIGKGKLYRNVPDYVAEAVMAEVTLSASDLQVLLSKVTGCTIEELVEHPLPKQSATTTLFTPESRFSNAVPNTSLSDLLKRGDWTIPAAPTTEKLCGHVRQAIFDGHKSLKLWETTGDVYVPLKVLSLWQYLRTASNTQRAWKAARYWVSLISVDASLKTRVQAMFYGFLSTGHLNAMLFRIRERVSRDPQLSQAVLVSSVDVTSCLMHTTSAYPEHAQMETKAIGQRLARNPNKHLLATVAYSHLNHWAAMCVDTRETHIRILWGDSLGQKQPKALAKGIKHWIKYHLPSRGYSFTTELPHGEQGDGVSCGVVTLNTLKHLLFQDPLWTNESRHQLRITEFCDVFDSTFPPPALPPPPPIPSNTPTPPSHEKDDCPPQPTLPLKRSIHPFFNST